MCHPTPRTESRNRQQDEEVLERRLGRLAPSEPRRRNRQQDEEVLERLGGVRCVGRRCRVATGNRMKRYWSMSGASLFWGRSGQSQQATG